MKRDEPLDAPLAMLWQDQPGVCRRCGELTHWRAPRQRTGYAHPGCEPSWPQLTDAAWGQVQLRTVIGAFSGHISLVGNEPRPRPHSDEIGPCGRCGAPCQRYGRGGMSWCASCRQDPAGELTPLAVDPTGPCGWCGRPGVRLPTVDRYFHCSHHLWPPFRWPDQRRSA